MQAAGTAVYYNYWKWAIFNLQGCETSIFTVRNTVWINQIYGMDWFGYGLTGVRIECVGVSNHFW